MGLAEEQIATFGFYLNLNHAKKKECLCSALLLLY